MSNSLRASIEGLAIADRARQRRGWTKTSTARWWQEANTSRATLRRFWQGDRIQKEIFIAICETVGISDWEAIAEPTLLPIEETFGKTPNLDLDEAPNLDTFFGRSAELQQLQQWVVRERCQVVAITGLGGIGKTALALTLVDQVQSEFSTVIWRSLALVPTLSTLLDSFCDRCDQAVAQEPQLAIAALIRYLNQHRTLLILDDWQAVLEQAETAKTYELLLQQLSQARHQSCILVISRQQPTTLNFSTKTSHHLSLRGFRQSEALELLQAKGFTGKELGLTALVRLYRGNPLALTLVVPLIQAMFGGNVAAFLNQNVLVVGDRLRNLFQQQLSQVTDIEKDILYWLAIWQEPISFCRLQTHFVVSPDPVMLLEGITALEGRSLLEKYFITDEPAFTLQPLVMKVVTDELIDQATQEIDQVIQKQDLQFFQVLRTHWLLRPGTDDVAGDRILTQLRERLWRVYGATLPQTLQQILSLLNGLSPLAIGYISCNLNALL